MKVNNYLYIHFVFLLLLHVFDCSAQSYGLRFASNETDQDRRTGLDLSPGKTFSFNDDFEVSFDISFNPDRSEYFGYILRIIGTHDKNIDLICDKSTPEWKHFQLIDGDKFTRIGFNIANNRLYGRWKSISLKFNVEKNLITLSDGNKYYTDHAGIKKGNLKVLFGANGFGEFKTTDVPSMNIRNIRIREKGKIRYYWKLDERLGERAKEELNNQDALVSNPLWIRKMHQEWELKKTISLEGIANICFNAEKEDLYIVGEDSLLTYHIRTDNIESVHYRSGKHHMFRAGESLYIPSSGNILSYYVDQKRVSIFDFKSSAWDREFTYPDTASDYWQTNKFYSPRDNSLYVLGGYGHFRYWDLVQRCDLNTRSWEHVNHSGDFFTPRYLAALGAADNGVYIMGGYGSATGRQALNPKSVYDLLFYDVQSRKFRKIYNLNIPHEEFVFANSLVIDSLKQVFYALIFPKHKYHSKLQMIESSLTQPVFREVGGEVPYLFRDITSFADLFYSPVSKRFIAVTLITDINNENTKIAVYSLLGPPIATQTEHPADVQTVNGTLLMGLLLLLCIGAGLIYNSYRLRKTKKILQQRVTTKGSGAKTEIAAVIPEVVKEAAEAPLSAGVKKSQIFLFGDFQMFDENQNEITKLFSPLIKELFLVILLYTIRWERGISSEKLKELLWFDKDAKLARNNRSVNIAKLKGILDKIPACRVSKETGFWKVDFDRNYLEVDYIKYLDIVKDRRTLDKERISALAAITQRGGFLSNAGYEWLDSFKAEISNDVIDTYQHFADSVKISEDPEFLIQVANYIFCFDPVNEEAMTMKCKALACLGKHSLARSSFESFVKEYKVIYGEDFNWDFNEVLNK